MSFDFAELLQARLKRVRMVPFENGPYIQAAYGTGDCKANWICDLPITFRDGSELSRRFLVAKNVNFTIMIGNDAFIKYKFTVCAYNERLTWRVDGKEHRTELEFAQSSNQNLTIKASSLPTCYENERYEIREKLKKTLDASRQSEKISSHKKRNN